MPPQDAETQRSQVANAVMRYRRNPNALEHERLLTLVAETHGPDAAEFFDREGCLPLSHGRALPWPMRDDTAWLFLTTRGMLSIMASLAALLGLTPILGLLTAFIIAGAVLAALWFGIPALVALVPPSDLQERHRLVQVYDELVQTNYESAEQRALEARMERLLRENDGE